MLTSRGHHIEQLLHQNNLVFLNDLSPTYLPPNPRNRQSAIDLTLTTAQLATKFSWHVQTDTYFSDHFPIHINIECDPSQNNFYLPRWNLRRAEWDRFTEQIDLEQPSDSSPNISNFLNSVIVSAQNHVFLFLFFCVFF